MSRPSSQIACETVDSTGGITVCETRIPGYAQEVTLRLYRPAAAAKTLRPSLPVVLMFHGGGFTKGGLDDADPAARFIAHHTPAFVVSVGYSLAPAHPFPAAPGDAYRAALWVAQHARDFGGAANRLGVAGYDAGGHIVASLTFIARDQGDVPLKAQVLVGPMLDPSLTRVGDETLLGSDITVADCAKCYRAYLPEAAQRLHPYAAPLESRRLAGLPPALIVTAQNDVLHVEAEKYAGQLIGAGVPTEVTRFPRVSHADLATNPAALAAIANFLGRRL
ncbi:alpha/beta hydrolase [Azospirillum sp. B4]|uniref:alpha/beta hydrolase n=1 Tax=Azospirillum sp. B4 TaxID=95605 RepID=UPI00034DA9FD|nr:alpha/beta hydrolase [Azospirillum sp. B4]